MDSFWGGFVAAWGLIVVLNAILICVCIYNAAGEPEEDEG